MTCSDKSLTILVGDDYFVCPREGGRIDGEGFDGYLICPDYNLICTGKKFVIIFLNVLIKIQKKNKILINIKKKVLKMKSYM